MNITLNNIVLGVELVAFHFGAVGDLNDNNKFLDKLYDIKLMADRKGCLAEYFHTWVELYQKDNTFYMYFTNVVIDDIVDGYIVRSNNATALFKVLAYVRGVDFDSVYIQEFIEVAKSEYGFNF